MIAYSGSMESAKAMLKVVRDLQADLVVMDNSIRNIWLRKVLGDTVLSTLTGADRPLFLSQ